MLLEQRHHESVFVTFTYSEESVPRLPDGRTNLNPEEFRLLLKRIRTRVNPKGRVNQGFRYFGVGEYGDASERAHFHLFVFAPRGVYWPYEDKFWQEVWSPDGKPKGWTSVSPGDLSRIRYCVGYTTKKLTHREDYRLDGRYPEFSRQSRKPPIGAQGIQEILDTMYSRAGAHLIASQGDVPTMYRYGGAIYPIGRYWRNWLRKQYGIEKPTQEDWTKPDDWNITLKAARCKEHAAAKRLKARKARAGRI